MSKSELLSADKLFAFMESIVHLYPKGDDFAAAVSKAAHDGLFALDADRKRRMLEDRQKVLFDFYRDRRGDVEDLGAEDVITVLGWEDNPKTRKWVRDKISEFSMPIKRRLR